MGASQKKKSFLQSNPAFSLGNETGVLYNFKGKSKCYLAATTYIMVHGISIQSKKIYNVLGEEQQVILDAISSGKFTPRKELPMRHNIWNKLLALEYRACQKAQSATGVLSVPSSTGGFVITVLNNVLGLPVRTAFEQYNESQAAQALNISTSLDFLEQLTAFIKEGAKDPYAQLAVLRAQRVAGMDVEIPDELVEQAKQTGGDKVVALWNDLEELGVEVGELYDEKHGVFAYKIVTPINCYIGSGTRKQIIDLAKRDVHSAATAKCPSCAQKIDYMNMDSRGVMQCVCGSIAGSIAENFAKYAFDLVDSKYGINGIYTVLKHWDELYRVDRSTGYNWLLLGKKLLIESPTVDLEGHHPSCSGNITTTIPVFGAWEEDDNIAESYAAYVRGEDLGKEYDRWLPFHIPSCSHCKHCVAIMDDSDAISGVESSYHYDALHMCVYPAVNNVLVDSFGVVLALKTEKMRGYRQDPGGIIWNAFAEPLFGEMKRVDSSGKDIEGKVLHPFNTVFGPICPGFDLDIDNMDLEPNGGPYRIIGEASVVFGLSNP
jgi:hypothetical protein